MVSINRTMFSKDTTVGTVTGSHIREDSLIQEMLPVIITAVIFMRLLSAEHRRSQCFQIRIDTFTGQCTAFYLPGIRNLELIQQTGIMTDNFGTGNAETAPLIGRTELIPVSDPLGDIPFKEIIIRRIFLIYINLIPGRNINLIRFLFYYLTNCYFRLTASVVKNHRDSGGIIAGTKLNHVQTCSF